jgi:hypothetical protein
MAKTPEQLEQERLARKQKVDAARTESNQRFRNLNKDMKDFSK